MQNNKIISGFSLVELSIVLLIAGLAVAGISSGAHLMQAAKLNKTISEITGYATAVNNFKAKYKAWPGDMPNATDYWGNAVTNGDGNESISETFQAWRQMALAGMIAGSYNGTSDLPLNSSIKGANYKLGGAGWTIFGTQGNYMQLSNTPNEGVINPADAYIIDTKIDDGVASSGNIYGVQGGNYWDNGCVTNNYNFISTSVKYVLTDSLTSCRMIYWLNKI